MTRATAKVDVELNARSAQQALDRFKQSVDAATQSAVRLGNTTVTFKDIGGHLNKATKAIKEWATPLNQSIELAQKAKAGIDAMMRAASEGAKANAAIASFEKMGGSIEQLRYETRGMISDFELVKQANLAKIMGIPTEAFGKLARIAQASAMQTGQSVEFMTSSIITAVARQSKQIADNLGLVVSVGSANEKYAKQLGKVASELTDAEKKQAFLNEVLEQGETLMQGVDKESAAVVESFEQMSARAENLKNNFTQSLAPAINNVLIPAFKYLGDAIDGASFKTFEKIQQAEDFAVWAEAFKQATNDQDRDTILAIMGQGRFGKNAPGGQSDGGKKGPVTIDPIDTRKLRKEEEARARAWAKRQAELMRQAEAEADIEAGTLEWLAGLRAEAEAEGLRRTREAAAEKMRIAEEQAEDEAHVIDWLAHVRSEAEAEGLRRTQERNRQIARDFQLAAQAQIDANERANQKVRAEAESTMAVYQKIADVIAGTFEMMARDIVDAIGQAASGAEVNITKMAAAWVQSVGTQIMAEGIKGIAAGAVQVAATGGAAGWQSIAVGTAAFGIGSAMAVSGAVASPALNALGVGDFVINPGGNGGGGRGGLGGSPSLASGINRRRGSGSSDGGESSATYIFNAPVYGDQNQAAAETHRLQVYAQRRLLQGRP